MIEFMNEAYVKGILDDVVADSKRLSRDDFYSACRRDIYKGYRRSRASILLSKTIAFVSKRSV
jgi:hypothetical protein